MTDTESLLQSLCARHANDLRQAYTQLTADTTWSLSTPVALIDNRRTDSRLTVVPVGGVSNVLPTSATIGNPLIGKWVALSAEMGDEEAMNLMLDQHEDEWADAYTAFKTEREERGRMFLGIEDLSSFAFKSRDCFPAQIAVMTILPGDTEKDWSIVTFSWSP